MGETDAGFRQRIHIWRLDPRPSLGVAADGAVAVVVGVNEEDVRALGSIGFGRGRVGGEKREKSEIKDAAKKSEAVGCHGQMVWENDPGVEVISGGSRFRVFASAMMPCSDP